MFGKRWVSMLFIFLIGIFMFIVNVNVSHAAVKANNEETPFLISGFVPFLSLILLIGGSITLTLTYVSWRKYKANKIKYKKKKRNSNH